MKRIITLLSKLFFKQSSWFYTLAVFLFIKWFFTGDTIPLIFGALVGCTAVVIAHLEYLVNAINKSKEVKP